MILIINPSTKFSTPQGQDTCLRAGPGLIFSLKKQLDV